MTISAVVNTLNAEKTIGYTLRSLAGWADHIVVVDMHSEDRTVDVAKDFGADVHLHERTGYVEPARAFAVDRAISDWILIIDADELAPRPLRNRLAAIARDDGADVVFIPTINYLFGAKLGHAGWGPDQDLHPRFFKRGHLLPSSAIHGDASIAPGSRVLKLTYSHGLGLVHFNYVDTADFIDRLNRYSSIEAEEHRGTIPPAPWRAVLSAARMFLSRYAAGRGYRDGWRGLYLSSFMALSRLAVYAKLKELELYGGRERIERLYRDEAERWLRA